MSRVRDCDECVCVCCRQLALTLKSLGTQHLHSVEIYKTYPEPYSVDDARWHWVRGKYNSYTLVLLTEGGMHGANGLRSG